MASFLGGRMANWAGSLRPRSLSVHLPVALLGVLFGLSVLFVATQAGEYGRTWDEGLQNAYGSAILRWYTSNGADIEFLTWWPPLHMPEHGPFFETVVAIAQSATDEVWLTRSVVGGLAGVLGLVGMALCGYELAEWWGALLAATGLALYPRYSGAIFTNSKDVPFAVAMVFVLWAAMRLVRRWDGGGRSILDSVLVGVLIGMATAIRVGALVWFGLLVLLWVGWWVRHGGSAVRDGSWLTSLRRQGLAAGVIGVVSYATMLALWPFLLLNPVSGLVDAARVMSAYDWTGIVLFDGEMVPAQDLPWQYVPGWLVVGSPPSVIALGLLGLGLVVSDAARGWVEPRVLLVVGSLFVPVATIMIVGSTLLNGLRHYLFVVPSLILLGAYGLVRLWLVLTASRRLRVLAAALVLAVLAGHMEVVATAIRLHPYEYAYFSPVAGGLGGAGNRYEADYWRSCETEAIRWIMAGAGPAVSVGGLFDPLTELPPGAAFAEPRPDYYVGSPYATAPPDYVPVHEISREGIVFCTVHRSPAA